MCVCALGYVSLCLGNHAGVVGLGEDAAETSRGSTNKTQGTRRLLVPRTVRTLYFLLSSRPTGALGSVLDDAIPLPNLRLLEDLGGTAHSTTRTFQSAAHLGRHFGRRHAHNIPHLHNGINVTGAWNNYEGLPANFSDRIDQVLERSGYTTRISGKTDWGSGSHSLNVRLNSWTMYTHFPYNVSENGGWRDETDSCRSDGEVLKGNQSAHQGDWETLQETTEWIKSNLKSLFLPIKASILYTHLTLRMSISTTKLIQTKYKSLNGSPYPHFIRVTSNHQC